MPEPRTDLDGLSGPTWDLAPAGEIRRRGDVRTRRRRVRTALAGVGAGALLAAPAPMVIGGLGGVATVAGDPRPSVVTATDTTRPTSVPPAPTSAAGSSTLALVEICGRTWSTDGRPARAADLRVVGAGAGGRRALLVYDDPAAADAALTDVRRTSDACASTDADDPVDTTPLGADADSWGFTTGPGEAVLAVRVGHTLLLSRSSTRGLDDLGAESVAALEQLCAVDADRC